jgi:hypothetical protein
LALIQGGTGAQVRPRRWPGRHGCWRRINTRRRVDEATNWIASWP